MARHRSVVQRRSIRVGGHRTRLTIEDSFWKALKQIAVARGTTLPEVIAAIDAEGGRGNLSSRVRLYVRNFYRDRLIPDPARQRSAVA
jgi:predicted DNA-binding ribbon-helix-helix protein